MFNLSRSTGVGHWIVEEGPELVLDGLRAFLREV
jgi:pimeloyl-ACP methyl ester carboxylesterase